MTVEAEVITKIPGRVRNRSVVGRTRSVVVKFDAPNAWSDGTTDDWSVDEVAHYEIDLLRNGVLFEQDLQVKSLRKSFPIAKADSWGNWSARIRAIGRDEQYATEDAATGAAVPENAGAESFSELSGSISVPQMGTLGISRYGSDSAMWAATAKDGDIWINTSYSPSRVYRRVGGTWTYGTQITEVFGTIIADAVIAGAIDGHTINGVYITGGRLATANNGGGYVYIQNDFIQLTSETGAQTLINASGNQIQMFGAGFSQLLVNGIVKTTKLVTGQGSGTPDAGFFAVYNNGTALLCKRPDGKVATLAPGSAFA